MAKPKKAVRTKEEIERDAKLEKEATRQRELVKNILWPLIINSSKNIEDAVQMLMAVGGAIQGSFQQTMIKEQTRLSAEKLGVLDVSSVIKPEKEFDRDRAILEALKDEPISTADALIGGLAKEIQGFVKMENKERPLASLKTAFLWDEPKK